MGGEWLRQKTGRRFTSTNVGLIRCHLMYYCQRKIRVCPCTSVAKRMSVRARHCLLPSASSPFSTAFFVFLHRHFRISPPSFSSLRSPRAILLESARRPTRVHPPNYSSPFAVGTPVLHQDTSPRTAHSLSKTFRIKQLERCFGVVGLAIRLNVKEEKVRACPHFSTKKKRTESVRVRPWQRKKRVCLSVAFREREGFRVCPCSTVATKTRRKAVARLAPRVVMSSALRPTVLSYFCKYFLPFLMTMPL